MPVYIVTGCNNGSPSKRPFQNNPAIFHMYSSHDFFTCILDMYSSHLFLTCINCCGLQQLHHPIEREAIAQFFLTAFSVTPYGTFILCVYILLQPCVHILLHAATTQEYVLLQAATTTRKQGKKLYKTASCHPTLLIYSTRVHMIAGCNNDT